VAANAAFVSATTPNTATAAAAAGAAAFHPEHYDQLPFKGMVNLDLAIASCTTDL
jgi:hypothetical protein